MTASNEIAKKNRKHNSGGIAPISLHVSNTLCIGIERFHTFFDSAKDKCIVLMTFIYLWLTQQLDGLTSATDIPSLYRVTGSDPCAEHRLRIVKYNNISWVEYAQQYTTSNKVIWQWQPIPTPLCQFFLQCMRNITANTQKSIINQSIKDRLWQFINSKWRTPKHREQYGRIKKDVFFRYFTIMTKNSPYLSTLAKEVLLQHKTLHHHSASAYQRENSNQIRHQIFHEQSNFLKRIIQAANQYRLDLTINNSHFKLSNLFNGDVCLPKYLTTAGEIIVFDRQKSPDNQGYQYVALPTISVGSNRVLPLDDVRAFFIALNDNVKQHIVTKIWTKTQLKAYYNALTYQLAFQFLILTGARPTHAISLETQRTYGGYQSTISDKGRYRTLYLCDHLRCSIEYYLSIQKNLLTRLGCQASSPFLWFLLDEDNQPQTLNARKMRQFMHKHWPYQNNEVKKIVPYCLRHTFAQQALLHTNPRLTTQQIDRLMGHSSFGEHLGSDQCFPISQKIYLQFLNQLSKKLYFNLDHSTLLPFSKIDLLQK